MVLWIVFGVLATLTLGLVLAPLLSRRADLVGGSDDVVYAAQIDEIEADVARGALAADEAAAARTEVARRLLRARHATGRLAGSGHRRWLVAALVAVFVPLFSVGTYVALGSPGYGDQPLSARLAPADATELAALVSRVEDRLASRPEDGAGWAAIAPVYLELQRFPEAAEAYEKAASLLGENAAFLTGQAQALIFGGEGAVTDEAYTLLTRAAELDPGTTRPRILLAIADRQKGDDAGAAERWRELLQGSDGSEPWLPIARAEIAQLPQDGGGTTAVPAAPGPSDATVAAVTQMAPADRNAMIEGMVGRLSERLQSGGGSVDEWTRLVRSYRVLGRTDDADAAIATAMAQLTGSERTAFAAATGALDPTEDAQ